MNRYGTFSQCCGAGKKGENIFKAAPEPVQESIFIQPEPPFLGISGCIYKESKKEKSCSSIKHEITLIYKEK